MYFARKAEPVSSKVLRDAELRKQHEKHKARIASMKPSIDTRPPPEQRHLFRNAKREQMMEDRYAKIEHENRLLLTKMSDIMTRPAAIDNESAAALYGHSLNRTRRARELSRITEENLRILGRIQTVAPEYDHRKWEDDRMRTERLLESMATVKPRRSRSVGAAMTGRGGSPRYGHAADAEAMMMAAGAASGGGGVYDPTVGALTGTSSYGLGGAYAGSGAVGGAGTAAASTYGGSMLSTAGAATLAGPGSTYGAAYPVASALDYGATSNSYRTMPAGSSAGGAGGGGGGASSYPSVVSAAPSAVGPSASALSASGGYGDDGAMGGGGGGGGGAYASYDAGSRYDDDAGGASASAGAPAASGGPARIPSARSVGGSGAVAAAALGRGRP